MQLVFTLIINRSSNIFSKRFILLYCMYVKFEKGTPLRLVGRSREYLWRVVPKILVSYFHSTVTSWITQGSTTIVALTAIKVLPVISPVIFSSVTSNLVIRYSFPASNLKFSSPLYFETTAKRIGEHVPVFKVASVKANVMIGLLLSAFTKKLYA